jgi:hypothetical protein
MRALISRRRSVGADGAIFSANAVSASALSARYSISSSIASSR